MIIQLKSRFARRAIHASCVSEEIELQSRVSAADFRGASQKFAGNYDGYFVTKVRYFRDRFRIPCAQSLYRRFLRGDNISVLAGSVCQCV